MKNKEKFTKEIVDIACNAAGMFGVKRSTGLPMDCSKLKSDECLFINILSCHDGRKEWADSEYIERPVISKNDRRFLDYIGNTYKYIVRDKDGKLFVCKDVHTNGHMWFTRGCVAGSDYTYSSGFDVQFPMVKNISSTVWSIEDLRKLEVVDEY